MAPLLEAKTVSKVYGGGLFNRKQTIALESASVAIQEDKPSIVAIAGESGSGKTTLARLLLGMTPPSTGQILYRGQDLWRLDNQQRRTFRREVQAVFQDPFEVYNPFYKVDHALTAPIGKFFPKATAAETQRMMEEALQAVGLRPEETLGRYPHQLSGGQKQRLMVARALLCQPKVVMADEPVSMVDASLRATILSSLRKLKQDFGISILYITHDLTTAYQISENILIMYAGSVVEAGSVEQVIRNPKHPYTQLLVSSIPLPDKNKRWGGVEIETVQNRQSTGCKFAPRCPAVMEQCWSQRPAYYTPDHDRTVNCFLYQDQPTLSSPDVAQVFPA